MRWLVGILLLVTAAAASEPITGRAGVIDGDTLEIHGTRIRPWGVDAPESSQLCRDDDAKHFRCGARAANDLDAFIGGRPVTCDGSARIALPRGAETSCAWATPLNVSQVTQHQGRSESERCGHYPHALASLPQRQINEHLGLVQVQLRGA